MKRRDMLKGMLAPPILATDAAAGDLVGKLHLSPAEGGRLPDRIDDGYDLFWWSHDLSNQWPTANMWRVWLWQQNIKWPSPPPHTPAWGVPIDPKYTQTAWCADRAIEFMREDRPFRPWLISVNIFQPHHPFWPTEEYFSRYDPAKLPLPRYREGELKTKSPYARTDHEGAYGGSAISFAKTDDLTHRKITAAYYAMIEQVDHAVGRMLDALKETGQDENMIVIYSSDHGEMLGDHGIYLKGPYFYFIYHSLGGWGELYDLEKDPWEFENLWDERSVRSIKHEMEALLIARMSETVDPHPLQLCAW